MPGLGNAPQKFENPIAGDDNIPPSPTTENPAGVAPTTGGVESGRAQHFAPPQSGTPVKDAEQEARPTEPPVPRPQDTGAAPPGAMPPLSDDPSVICGDPSLLNKRLEGLQQSLADTIHTIESEEGSKGGESGALIARLRSWETELQAIREGKGIPSTTKHDPDSSRGGLYAD